MHVGVSDMARGLCISLENARIRVCLDKDLGLHITKSFNMVLVLHMHDQKNWCILVYWCTLL